MIVSGMWLPKWRRSERKIALPWIQLRRLAHIFGREAAAEIDGGERNAALGAGAEHRRGRGQRAVPGFYVVLLRADMERDAVGGEALLMGALQDIGREFRLAAELA